MSTPPTIAVVIGTRPEAIKLAPVVHALAGAADLRVRVIATGQHLELLDAALADAGLRADQRLALQRGEGLNGLLGALLPALDGALAECAPAWVVVHGDTTSALAGALAAHHRGLPVAHVEAGLRSGDPTAPFPEETNRRLVAGIATLHLAPTERAAAALVREGVDPRGVVVTGNTIVDVVQARLAALPGPQELPAVLAPARAALDGDCVPIVATLHRREASCAARRATIAALRDALDRDPRRRLVIPVHPSPLVRGAVEAAAAGDPRVVLLPPVNHDAMLWLLRRAALVITDSGGIQEEAPSVGAPVLVVRTVTERPEAIEAGLAELVGLDPAALGPAIERWLARPRPLPGHSPFGRGDAGARCAAALRRALGLPANAAASGLQDLARTRDAAGQERAA